MTNPTDSAPVLLSDSEVGRRRRLGKLVPSDKRKIIIVPVDDSLIFGPANGLENMTAKLSAIIAGAPDALLAFPGLFRAYSARLHGITAIVNITASTKRSQHTRKVLIGTVAQAIRLGAEAVAVHVNVSSRYECEMLRTLGMVANKCAASGMPLLAIMYPRGESSSGDNNYEELKSNNREQYAALVAHAARIGVDLGADLIKTQYTGDRDSFRSVVEACRPVPLLIAGGPMLSMPEMLQVAHDAIAAGGAGISFGRNVFSRDDPRPFITALKAVVHDGCAPEEAMRRVKLCSSEPEKVKVEA